MLSFHSQVEVQHVLNTPYQNVILEVSFNSHKTPNNFAKAMYSWTVKDPSKSGVKRFRVMPPADETERKLNLLLVINTVYDSISPNK